MTIVKFPVKLNDIELADCLVRSLQVKAHNWVEENKSHESVETRDLLKQDMFCGYMVGWISNLLKDCPQSTKEFIVDECNK